MVHFVIRHLEVDEQLLVVVSPVEVEFGQQSHAAHGCVTGFVCQCCYRFSVYYGIGNQRYCFVDHITIGVSEDTLVVDGEDLLEYAVGVLDLLFKWQVRHQSHLVSDRCTVAELGDEGFGQSLLEHHELVDVPLKAVTTEEHITYHAGQAVGSKGNRHLVIQINGHVVICTVDNQYQVVPRIRADLTTDDLVGISIPEDEFAILESEAFISDSENRTIGACRAEPQHVGAIINSRPREYVACQADTVRLVYRQGEPLWQVPRRVLHRECRS